MSRETGGHCHPSGALFVDTTYIKKSVGYRKLRYLPSSYNENKQIFEKLLSKN